MAKEHLFALHFENQAGCCAICNQPLPADRWACRVDRHPVRGKDGGEYVPENTRLICLDCDWAQEGNAPSSPRPRLRAAYQRYRMYNQMKGDFTRRLKALDGQTSGTTRSPYLDPAEMLVPIEFFTELEAGACKALKGLVRQEPEWAGFMKASPGMQELTAAFCLSHIDIERATTVSKIWRYLGLDPTEKYNPGKGQMRAPLYAALSIFLMRKDGAYRPLYDDYKAREVSHGGAIRRLLKLWLAHLYETWRLWKGLPVRPPYSHRDGSEYPRATDFGWPEV